MATVLPSGASPQIKTIRFVNNAGQPPQKRRRINAACLTCRKRKTRCAGEHPTCSTCAKNGHNCLGYTDIVDKRRGSASAGEFARAGPNGEDEDDFSDEVVGDDQQSWKPDRTGPGQHEASVQHYSHRRKSEATASDNSEFGRLKTETIDWDERRAKEMGAPKKLARRPTNGRNESFSTEDSRSPHVRSPIQLKGDINRIPFFRYFGPTAIVPGYKQMIVETRQRRRSSMSTTSPGSGNAYVGFMDTIKTDDDSGNLDDLPVYDPNDNSPVHQIILSLVETFFVHLGCNYPFLNRNKFSKLVRERSAEPVLVDAVCAVAARFSDLPIFTKSNVPPARYGHAYAQRAKSAIIDTFPCPQVFVVQASLLIAYETFGSGQDSALWIYLGQAIRIAQDLGLHKKDGVKYQGEKDPWFTQSYSRKTADRDSTPPKVDEDEDELPIQKQRELEQERIDTLWSVYLLDRIISSGTGRLATFRDDDFELDLPRASIDAHTGWPDPYPVLIQMIHLYGQVSDILNKNIRDQDPTQHRISRLVQLEPELTKFHQKLDPRLRFDMKNFETYVSFGQGTTFILLHLWFHALIIVLHHPTPLAPLMLGNIHELVPHSRELSMSSAKTISDILAFAKLIDAKSFVGNPFTSQPIYIAACAWIGESFAYVSHPVSTTDMPLQDNKLNPGRPSAQHPSADVKMASRHTLLASAAARNFQFCYEALKQLHERWGGIGYILTALDQKSEGKTDCETYTNEEWESTRIVRRPGSIARLGTLPELPAGSPGPSGPPLAWSLTGTTNSPNPSLTLLYQPNSASATGMGAANPQAVAPAPAPVAPVSAPTPPGNMIYDPIRQSLPEATRMCPPGYVQPHTSALRYSINSPQTRSAHALTSLDKPMVRFDGIPSTDSGQGSPTAEMKMRLNVASSTPLPQTVYTPTSQGSSGYDASGYPTDASPQPLADARNSVGAAAQGRLQMNGDHQVGLPSSTSAFADVGPSSFAQNGIASGGYSFLGPAGNMELITINDTADITQHLNGLEPADMANWFGEWFPQDVMDFTSL